MHELQYILQIIKGEYMHMFFPFSVKFSIIKGEYMCAVPAFTDVLKY